MNSSELNLIPQQIKSGIITKKTALNLISTFICENYPVFGLHKFDEDFREDILVYFLERGEHILDTYDENYADFFTYLYSNILSYIQTKRRMLAKSQIKESLLTADSIDNYNDKQHAYESINFEVFETPKVPYSYTPISAENLRKIFEPLSHNNKDKKLLVLAMKSSFYITHEQISEVSEKYNIDIDDMYKSIEYLKQSIDKRFQKHKLAIERRNSSYFLHRRCDYELEAVAEKNTSNEVKSDINKKNERHQNNLERMNKKFADGYLHLRPTNKTIAYILDICERQVTYYINCAKKDYENKYNKTNVSD